MTTSTDAATKPAPDPRDDGGPAFPTSGYSSVTLPETGMTPREPVAEGQTLAGLLSSGTDPEVSLDMLAADAFDYADAMLKARG